MTFGIPSSVLPFDDTGKYDFSNHFDWLKQRKALEARRRDHRNLTSSFAASDGARNSDDVDHSSRADDCIIDARLIRPRDVICGRDKLAQNHPGNFFFQHIVASHLEKYNDSPKDDKTVLTIKIVKMVEESGRFLKRTTSGWVELGDKEAYEKVSNAFRSFRKSILKKKKVRMGRTRRYSEGHEKVI